MRISIRISSLMENRSRYPGSGENRYIRVPFELRDICELKVGSFVNLRSTGGKIVTLKVNPAYNKDVTTDPLSAYVSRGVFEALELELGKKRYEQEIDVIEGMTLGCDPEFFLVNAQDWSVVRACSLFYSKYGQLGYDGLLMELRPLPSTDEKVIVDSLWRLIQQARTKFNSMKLRGLTSEQIMMVGTSHYKGITAGFHLHFGLPPQLLGGVREGVRWHVKNQIARAMDYYVGIPSILPEGQEDYIRRTSKHIEYGKPGEWRQEGVTFEYRVPGGFLLRHPILTLGILGLGAIVMEDTLSRIKACTNSFQDLKVISSTNNLKEIYPNVLGIFDLYKVICSKDLTIAKVHLNTILDDLTKMVGFEKRKDSIEQMFRCIYDGTKFCPDLEKNWRSFYEKQQRSVDVLSA